MKLPVDNYDFPSGWKILQISDVADFTRGVSWRKADEVPANEGLLVISIPNIKAGWIDYQSKFNHYLGKSVTTKKLLNIGDIVFVGSSGSVHNVGRNAQITSVPDEGMAFASFTFKAVPRQGGIDKQFFYFLVNSDIVPFSAFCKRAADGKFNFQLRDFASRLRIPVPPLPEQKKIAHILSTVQQAIEAQEKIIQTTTELKKALMQKLFTEGTRGEPQKETEIGLIPESWEVVELGAKAESFQYGTSVKCGYDVEGKPVLRIPNVIGGHIDPNDLKFGKPKPNEIGKLKLERGDLLFVRTNGVKENAGRCSKFNDELNDCYFASYLIRVRLDPSVLNPDFLNEYTRTAAGTSFLSGKAIRTADGKFNINSGTLKTMLFPVPGIGEQYQIAETLALVDTKAVNLAVKKKRLQDIFSTLLHELMTAKTRVHELEVS